MRRLAGILLSGLLIGVTLAWCVGFARFATNAMQPPGEAPLAEGIVVLTGGAGRIEAALSLLARNRARLMLITGVAPDLSLAQLVPRSSRNLVRIPGLPDRITLGHLATTTLGNARETADWARANDLHSLIVVTAGYHMQRAVLEIGAVLPGTLLLPYPVLPPALHRPASLGTLRLLVSEYDKFLLVASGIANGAVRDRIGSPRLRDPSA